MSQPQINSVKSGSTSAFSIQPSALSSPSSAPSPELRRFIQSLPKTETHLHIEGALPYELLRAWQPEKYPADPFFHAPDFRFREFPKFDEVLLGHALPWFTSAERYYESSKAVFAKHVAQNVRYVETSFHLPVTQFI